MRAMESGAFRAAGNRLYANATYATERVEPPSALLHRYRAMPVI